VTAGLWVFLFSLLVSPFRRKPVESLPQDPEILQQQAQWEMSENQAKNRERAVQAITQKNNLQAECDKLRRIIQRLEQKAENQLQVGDEYLAHRLGLEADIYRVTLTRVEAAHARAVETTEAIKTAIRREEEHIRAKTVVFMAAKTELRQIQISASVEQSAIPESSYSAQQRLDTMLMQVERTRTVLWDEAQAALQTGDDTRAIRLLIEHQQLDAAMHGSRSLK
jgi:phage shock protein A